MRLYSHLRPAIVKPMLSTDGPDGAAVSTVMGHRRQVLYSEVESLIAGNRGAGGFLLIASAIRHRTRHAADLREGDIVSHFLRLVGARSPTCLACTWRPTDVLVFFWRKDHDYLTAQRLCGKMQSSS